MVKVILGGSILYLVANFFLTKAWKLLLQWFGEKRINFKESVRIYSRSQILKYIPGNIFYLPGRHLLGRQIGLDHGTLVGAATFEIIGIVSASSFFSILGILFIQGNKPQFSLLFALIVLILTLATPLIAKYLFSRWNIFQKFSVFQAVNLGNYPRLIAIWLVYICFFIITGIALLLTITAINGVENVVPLPVAFSIYATSWFLGFVTPGAPAGVGVRDGIIILTLSSFIGETNSIVVSIIMRVITTLGDVVFYFLGIMLGFCKGGNVDEGKKY